MPVSGAEQFVASGASGAAHELAERRVLEVGQARRRAARRGGRGSTGRGCARLGLELLHDRRVEVRVARLVAPAPVDGLGRDRRTSSMKSRELLLELQRPGAELEVHTTVTTSGRRAAQNYWRETALRGAAPRGHVGHRVGAALARAPIAGRLEPRSRPAGVRRGSRPERGPPPPGPARRARRPENAPADEVLVVDDHSDDDTAVVADAAGVAVAAAPPLPDGWTGKTWLRTGASARRATCSCSSTPTPSPDPT